MTTELGTMTMGTLTKPDYQLRAEKLFRKRPTTAYDRSEAKAWLHAKNVVKDTAEEDWQALEKFYAAPQAQTYARKTYAVLLNNWNGEIERAKNWLRQRQQPTTIQPKWQPTF